MTGTDDEGKAHQEMRDAEHDDRGVTHSYSNSQVFVLGYSTFLTLDIIRRDTRVVWVFTFGARETGIGISIFDESTLTENYGSL